MTPEIIVETLRPLHPWVTWFAFGVLFGLVCRGLFELGLLALHMFRSPDREDRS